LFKSFEKEFYLEKCIIIRFVERTYGKTKISLSSKFANIKETKVSTLKF